MHDHYEKQAGLVAEIQRLIARQLAVEVASPEEDLLATSVLDSLTLVQLLADLEQHFSIRISLEDLEIDDLRSIRSIARLVKSKLLSAHEGKFVQAVSL